MPRLNTLLYTRMRVKNYQIQECSLHDKPVVMSGKHYTSEGPVAPAKWSTSCLEQQSVAVLDIYFFTTVIYISKATTVQAELSKATALGVRDFKTKKTEGRDCNLLFGIRHYSYS